MGNFFVYSKEPNKLCTSEEGSRSYYKYGASTVQGWRRTQEDRLKCIMDFYKDFSFFAVYDGHGGSEVAVYIQKRLHDEVASFLELDEHDPELALQLSFLSCDNNLKEAPKEEINEIIQPAEFQIPDRKIAAVSKITDPDVAGTSTDGLVKSDEFKAAVSSEVLKFLASDKLEPEESEDDDEDYDVEKDMDDSDMDDTDECNGETSVEDDCESKEEIKSENDDESNGESSSGGGDDDKSNGGADSEKSDDEETNNEEDVSVSSKIGFECGSTATVVLLHKESIYVANVGDSKCIASIGGKGVDLSLDHKPTDEEEQERIVNAGSRVTGDGRIDGGLNLSRAFGDFSMKNNPDLSPVQQAVSCDPFVKSLKITEDVEFVVLASDGIWNSMSTQEVVDFVRIRLQSKDSTLTSICNELFNLIIAPDTDGDGTGCDNMACIIIQLNNSKEPWYDYDPVMSEVDLGSS